MEALASLGVDWKLFLAQAINFLVLLFILRRFAYRPMLHFLEKRSDRIEQGLKDAKTAETMLAQMEAKEKEMMSEAREAARAIVNAAEIAAKKRDVLRLRETEEKTKHFLAEALIRITEEKKMMLAEAHEEFASVVSLSVEKILKETVDAPKDSLIIEKISAPHTAIPQTIRQVSLPQNLFKYLGYHGEKKKMEAIVKYLEKNDEAKEGRIAVTVVTAHEVTEKNQAALALQAENLFPQKKIKLYYERDPNLIGGAVFRTDEMLYDVTIGGRAQALKKSLLKA